MKGERIQSGVAKETDVEILKQQHVMNRRKWKKEALYMYTTQTIPHVK